MPARLLKLVTGPELGLLSTILFAGLYTWPLLTSQRPSGTFRFVFVVWCVHVALLALTSFANKLIGSSERSSTSDSAPTASERV